ncbi:MAG: hypothetical protein KDA98_04350 [Acidimicrobiales bacterium]|nr:hypothetical protein [Acidimicrobiales bacterium]
MRVRVFVNDAAGSVDEAERDRHHRELVDAFEAAGAEAEVTSVAPEELGDAVVGCWEGEDRPDVVVVAGGDGTVGCAAQAAAGTDVVLGVVPLGTFNHFAGDLGLSEDLGAAARALVGGEVRALDVGEVSGRVFVNNSVLGAYPDMVAIRDVIRDRRGWGKVRAVPVAVVAVARRFPVHRLDLVGPGYERRRVRTPLVFVGNGTFGDGSGGPPQRTALDDGVLGVGVARVVSRWGLVRALVRALVRGTDGDGELDHVELAELTVSSRRRRLRVALDGEVVRLDLPLRYRVRPGALRVLVPADAAGER